VKAYDRHMNLWVFGYFSCVPCSNL
jgi:hypothetical protein